MLQSLITLILNLKFTQWSLINLNPTFSQLLAIFFSVGKHGIGHLTLHHANTTDFFVSSFRQISQIYFPGMAPHSPFSLIFTISPLLINIYKTPFVTFRQIANKKP